LDFKKEGISMIIEDGLIKELLKIGDSISFKTEIRKREKQIAPNLKENKEVVEKVEGSYCAVGVDSPSATMGQGRTYRVVLVSSIGPNLNIVVGTTDDQTEARETARKLASALQIDFRGVEEGKVPEEGRDTEKEKIEKLTEKEYSPLPDDDDELRTAFYKYMEEENVPTWYEGISSFAKKNHYCPEELENRLSHIIESKLVEKKTFIGHYRDVSADVEVYFNSATGEITEVKVFDDGSKSTLTRELSAEDVENYPEDIQNKLKFYVGENKSKLTEQDEEPEEVTHEEPKPEEPEKEIPSEPEKPKEPQKPEATEITKEYVGNTEDTHYYLISTKDEEGNVEDLQIVDQEGTEKFSAKDHSIDVNNVPEFLFKGIKELKIESIEFGVFERYLFPYVFEENEETEEETPEELEELPEKPEVEQPKESKTNESKTDHQNNIRETGFKSMSRESLEKLKTWMKSVEEKDYPYGILKTDLEKVEDALEELRPRNESKTHLIEMKITDHKNNLFDVYLVDDRTTDTVIDVNGKEFRFDSEFASYWRDEDGALSEEGLEQLALDALSNMEEEDYNELLVKATEQRKAGWSKDRIKDLEESTDDKDIQLTKSLLEMLQ